MKWLTDGHHPDVQVWNDLPTREPSLLFAGLVYKDENFFILWRKLNPDPTNEEVRRNIAIEIRLNQFPPRLEIHRCRWAGAAGSTALDRRLLYHARSQRAAKQAGACVVPSLVPHRKNGKRSQQFPFLRCSPPKIKHNLQPQFFKQAACRSEKL
jgi:hypothetical protein